MPNCPTPCPNCPRKHRPLPADGPLPARFLAISDFPGEVENRTGRVQTGKGGEELCRTYLPLAGLRRSDFRITNVRQCFPGQGKSVNKTDARDCAPHHIPQEILDTRPEVIFLMGGSATALCDSIDIDAMHGIPQHTSKVGQVCGTSWSGWVVPFHNPAFGLREGKGMTYLLEDWANVMRELGNPGDAVPPEPDYRLVRTAACVDEYMRLASYTNGWVGADTEDHGDKPFSVQVSVAPRTGIFIPAGCREALERLDTWINNGFDAYEADYEVVWHNADHDTEVIRRLGLSRWRFRDTMQEAFQLCNLPQGLKDLAYRLFRVTMSSWKENVRPVSINALLSWLSEAAVIARLDLYSTKVKEYKTCGCGHAAGQHGKATHDAKCPCRVYTPRQEVLEVPGDAESLFKRLCSHTDQDSDYDPWERLSDWRQESESEYSHVMARIGHWPILGIGNCSEAQAIRYAVGDADFTLQCAQELERRRQEGKYEIAEGDADV